MELFEAISKRHMCRDFIPNKDVPDEIVEQIVDAGKAAPSSGGLRDQRFIVIRDPETKRAIRAAGLDQATLTDAPVVIAVYSETDLVEAKYGDRGKNLYAAQNSAAAMQNMLLAVTALELGACWAGAFEEEPVKKILGLTQNQRPMALMPLGYCK